MTTILVVCTGNICRSPIAEGLLRGALAARFGDAAPAVTSAGTMARQGSPAMAESVSAASERGVQIASHLTRELSDAMIEDADLVLCMAAEHRTRVAARGPAAAAKAFTLKELVQVLEQLPRAPSGAGPASLAARIAQAETARREGATTNPYDEDVADPLGMPLISYQAIAWELDEWTSRLADGLYGAAPQAAEG